MASGFHRNLCEEEFVYSLECIGVARIGRDILQAKAKDFIGCLAGGKSYDPLNRDSSCMICIVFEQRPDFDFVDYPEQDEWIYRYAGSPADLYQCCRGQPPAFD